MSKDNFEKYEDLRDENRAPTEVYLIARSEGLSFIASIRMLRLIFNMSLEEAKEMTVIAHGLGESLADYQEKLIPGLEEVLRDDAE